MKPAYRHGAILLLVFLAVAAALLYWELRRLRASGRSARPSAPAAVSQTTAADSRQLSSLNAPDVEEGDTRSPEEIEADEQEIIHVVQTIPASRLESGLPARPFGDWLNTVVGRLDRIQWEANDCGENDGSGKQESVPVCGAAEIVLADNWQLSIWIAVGSQAVKGADARPKFLGKPEIAWIWLSKGESDQGGCGLRLADVPKVVNLTATQLAAQCSGRQ